MSDDRHGKSDIDWQLEFNVGVYDEERDRAYYEQRAVIVAQIKGLNSISNAILKDLKHEGGFFRSSKHAHMKLLFDLIKEKRRALLDR
jgi:hypothetical protein